MSVLPPNPESEPEPAGDGAEEQGRKGPDDAGQAEEETDLGEDSVNTFPLRCLVFCAFYKRCWDTTKTSGLSGSFFFFFSTPFLCEWEKRGRQE